VVIGADGRYYLGEYWLNGFECLGGNHTWVVLIAVCWIRKDGFQGIRGDRRLALG